jgi:hypothetical protein
MDPRREAIDALLGASGSPAERAAGPSAGEQVLLTSANAAAASGDIRVQLEEEKVAAEESKPYSPPSIGELFGGKKKEKVDEAEILEPVAESQRLQREGVRAPADPNAEAEKAEDERPDSVQPYYPSGRPGRPFTAPGTGPAF